VFDGPDVSIPCTYLRLAQMIFAQDPERRNDDSDADRELDGSGRLHAGIVQIRGGGSPTLRRTVARRMRTAPPWRRPLSRRRSLPGVDGPRHTARPGAGQRPWRMVESVFTPKRHIMNRIVYIVGLVVIVIAILSFFGLR
jgi:hypothetical protein